MPYDSHVIDVHTHFFNARHMPLKNIFEGYGLPGPAAYTLARISNFLTNKAESFGLITDFLNATDNVDELASFSAELAIDANTRKIVSSDNSNRFSI